MLAKRLFVCLLLLTGANALADQNSKEAKLQELLKWHGAGAALEEQLADPQEAARETSELLMADFKKHLPDLDAEVLAEMEQAAIRFTEATLPTWTMAEAAKAWIKFYGEHVTEQELDQILAYYRSPAGRKDVAASTKAANSWFALVTERDNRALEAAQAVYMEELKDIVERANQKNAGQ